MIQEAPFCIQIEPTEGCNLACTFCGVQGMRAKAGGPYKFMLPTTAATVAQGVAAAGWTARIEFAMHGEPTLNPQMVEIVETFRRHLPRNQLMMTSNGGGLLKEPEAKITALFSAGLNILALDDYDTVNIVPKLLQRIAPTGLGMLVRRYPQDGLRNSPHRRHPPKTRMIVVLEDIVQATKGGHATLNNHCGAGGPLDNSAAGKRCAKPFREMSIRWNGEVALCCNDFRGAYKCGKLMRPADLVSVWQGAAFQAARKRLLEGQRTFTPCEGCNALSTRVGLLPDKLGQHTMEPFTPADAAALREAVAGGAYAPIVLRKWEQI